MNWRTFTLLLVHAGPCPSVRISMVKLGYAGLTPIDLPDGGDFPENHSKCL